MGEKYDGTRVCWNPRQHMLYLTSILFVSVASFILYFVIYSLIKYIYSRYAVPLDIPPVLLSTFASMFLDGEIWYFFILLYSWLYVLCISMFLNSIINFNNSGSGGVIFRSRRESLLFH